MPKPTAKPTKSIQKAHDNSTRADMRGQPPLREGGAYERMKSLHRRVHIRASGPHPSGLATIGFGIAAL
eukprot:scaffold348796_cov18-Prasinocladus_malaysianus.AAC.2